MVFQRNDILVKDNKKKKVTNVNFKVLKYQNREHFTSSRCHKIMIILNEVGKV